MGLSYVLIVAALTVASAIFFIRRLMKWSDIIKWRGAIDVIFTGTLMALFVGTLGGTLIAATAGLMLSILLSVFASLAKIKQKAKHHLHTMKESAHA